MLTSIRLRVAALGVIALAALLALPGPALAAKPFHGSTDETFVDPNFCGEGFAVTVHVTNQYTDHEKAVRGILYFSTTYSGVDTITYEPTGKTATVEYRGQSKDQKIVDNGDGTLTIQTAVNGLAGRVTLPDGTVLYSDRGRVVFEVVIDHNGTLLDASDDTFVEDHGIVFQAGPHPQADSGFSLFCDVLPAALTAT